MRDHTRSDHSTRAPNANASNLAGKVVGQVNWDAAMLRAEWGYAKTLRQTRLLSAACFFIAAALAVGAPGGQVGVFFVLLGVAVVASATSEIAALLNFRQEIERTAREAGLSEDATRNALLSMSEAFRR